VPPPSVAYLEITSDFGEQRGLHLC
jgi:hypothetical protein